MSPLLCSNDRLGGANEPPNHELGAGASPGAFKKTAELRSKEQEELHLDQHAPL